jgi:hypothetical protein
MCVTSKSNIAKVQSYLHEDSKMDIKVTVPVYEVNLEQVDNVDIIITNHPMRRDYVIIEKGDVSLTVSPSDIERAMQAAKLAHRI